MNSSQMKVFLFAGDCLTEGRLGESYVSRVSDALARGHLGLWGETFNAGRRGDTVRSLLARIDDELRAAQPDWTILSIGSNDVWFRWLGSRSLGWWLWLTCRRLGGAHAPVADLDRFAACYRALIDRVRSPGGGHVLACTVSPLGEELDSALNQQVARLNGVIQRVAIERRVPLADVWQAFVDELAPLPRRSGYLPSWLWSGAWDRRRLARMTLDELSRRRGLHLTFDGIHPNSRGADLWATTILRALLWACKGRS